MERILKRSKTEEPFFSSYLQVVITDLPLPTTERYFQRIDPEAGGIHIEWTEFDLPPGYIPNQNDPAAAAA